ncbi:hypothetical protein C2E23DRAFT_746781 [Lenzites betulinus]|nr:hypothetical protein C2E23DRAFT_746781 [Lenzites betulinus]
MVAQSSSPGVAFASLSTDTAIQLILADVPFFAVGILAFGVLTFFFLMKRVDRLVFCLHVSVLLAFLAALFDLSQVLIRGEVAVDQGLNTAGVAGLITAREVFYAFSNGLRFLFYWGFVAAIPQGETMAEGSMMHSGSWQRWGILGSFLKWATLLLVVLVTIFQILYRDVQALEQIGPVYEVEAALEIITSAVFVLKLLLNTWARSPANSTAPSRGALLVQYAPMVLGLMFSLWIAAGNAILFNFTETALGRFLRAIELYILIVYMLSISFHHLRHLSFFPIYRPATKGPSRAPTFERNSVAKFDTEKGIAVSSPAPPTVPVRVDLMQVLEQQFRQQDDMPPTVMRDSSRAATVENVSQHQSMAARLSTWLAGARPLPRPPTRVQDVQPWDVDMERGPSPRSSYAPEQPWYAEEKPRLESPPLPLPPVDEDEQRGVTPLPESATRSEFERDIASPAPSSTREYPPAPGIIEPDSDEDLTPVPDRDWEDMEYSNAVRYSGVGEDMVAHALSQQYYEAPDTSRLLPLPTGGLSPAHSRMGSVDAGYIGSPYPMSPIGSAAVSPLPRSRPLPPMPRPLSQLLSPSSPMPPDSARSSNMSILLRRQTELDESIAALRLFSPSKMVFDMNKMPVQQSKFYDQLAQPTISDERLSTVPSMESPELPAPSPDFTLATPRADRIPQSSAQSEFSFSQFQPPLNRGSMDSSVIPRMGIAVEAPSEMDVSIRTPSPMSELMPPRMPAAMASRFSENSSIGEGRTQRTDSLGTQYEITSFIGNLTIPGSNKDSTISSSSVGISEDGSVDVAVARKADLSAAQYARPTLVLPPPGDAAEGLGVSSEPSPAMSPMRTPSGGRRALPPIPQPAAQQPSGIPRLAKPTSPQQPMSAARPSPPVSPPTRFRRAVGLPPRPRLSVVNLTPVEERTSPSDSPTTLVSSPQSGSGTPKAGNRW